MARSSPAPRATGPSRRALTGDAPVLARGLTAAATAPVCRERASRAWVTVTRRDGTETRVLAPVGPICGDPAITGTGATCRCERHTASPPPIALRGVTARRRRR